MDFARANHVGEHSPITISPGWMLLCALIFFICVTASNSWSDLAVLFSLLAAGSVLHRVGASVYVLALRSSWMLVVLAVVFHLVFRIWFAGEQAHGVVPAILDTSFFICRLLLLVGMTFMLLRIFSPAEYAEAAATRLRVVIGKSSAAHAGHVMMLSFSMLPQIQEHMSQRKLARKLRGMASPQGFGGKLDYARSELNAALRYALDYASILAVVLWSRGFDPKNPVQLAKRQKSSSLWAVAAIGFCILCLTTLLPSRIN